MLRAGIALAASTREEKGQSWLAKRESSTSLLSDVDNDVGTFPAMHHHHHNGHGHRTGRKATKSGKSTPGAYSRHASGSRRGSWSGSRLDMALTPGMGDGGGVAHVPSRRSRSGIASPVSARSFPDFVDEGIRTEMASLQHERDIRDGLSPSSTASSDIEEDSEEDIDEQEMRRLTRERGFGFGGWLDRLVEWTLFSVDEAPPLQDSQRRQDAATPPTTSSEQTGHDRDSRDVQSSEERNINVHFVKNDELQAEATDEDDDALSTIVEKPGDEGGWQDVGWLLRAVKGAL